MTCNTRVGPQVSLGRHRVTAGEEEGVLDAGPQLDVIRSGVAGIHPADSGGAASGTMRGKLAKGVPLRVKLGVDPTAPDLHLGHAVPLRKLRQFQDLGHVVVLIIGDYTALIGDPSGRSATRPALSSDRIDANAETFMEQAFKILDRDRTELRRNSDWLGELDFAGILRYASMFTVARTLERDDFAARLAEQRPIALHELLYPVMQAYDSVVVEADVEIGGTDQLFNLLAGRELMQKLGMEPQVCLTLPLLEGTDGVQKMSKSYGNYVGLTEEPRGMFGKVMSIPDVLMPKYYRLCTALAPDEADAVEAALADGSLHPNEAKRGLARAIVTLYHSAEAAAEAEVAFDRVFKDRELPRDVTEVVGDWGDPVYLPGALKDLGLVSTASEGRRAIDQGGVRIEGDAVAGGDYSVTRDGFVGRVVQVGKRRFARPVEKG